MDRRLVLAGFAALALGGCGRRGALEEPPDPSAPPAVEAPSNPAGGPIKKRKKKVPINVPKDPFILDPLL